MAGALAINPAVEGVVAVADMRCLVETVFVFPEVKIVVHVRRIAVRRLAETKTSLTPTDAVQV